MQSFRVHQFDYSCGLRTVSFSFIVNPDRETLSKAFEKFAVRQVHKITLRWSSSMEEIAVKLLPRPKMAKGAVDSKWHSCWAIVPLWRARHHHSECKHAKKGLNTTTAIVRHDKSLIDLLTSMVSYMHAFETGITSDTWTLGSMTLLRTWSFPTPCHHTARLCTLVTFVWKGWAEAKHDSTSSWRST